MNRKKHIVSWLACLAALTAFSARTYPGFDGPSFVKSWLLSGPWPNAQIDERRVGLDADFLNGERDAAPRADRKLTSVFIADKAKLIAEIGARNEWGFKEDQTFDASWRKHDFADGRCMVDGLFSPIDDYFVFYAAVYVETDRETDGVIALGADDYHRIWLDRTELGRDQSGRGVRKRDFRYKVRLTAGVHRILLKVADLTNNCGFCLELLSNDGQPLSGVKTFTDPGTKPLVVDALRREAYRPDRLKAADAKLNAACQAAVRAREDLLKRRTSAKAAFVAARDAYRDAIGATEGKLLSEHACAAASQPKSLDLPLQPASLRRRLLLNGVWQGRIGKKGAKWHDAPLPSRIFGGSYFISSVYPVANLGMRKFGPHPDFPDVTVPEVVYKNGGDVEFKTSFDWDGEGAVEFVCETAIGRLQVSVNGVPCGKETDTVLGEVRVPLTAMKKGRNELTLHYRHSAYHVTKHPGILGDVALEFVPTVRVREVAARAKWLQAALESEATVFNGSSEDVNAEVRQAVCEGGRIRLKLPVQTIELKAGETKNVKSLSGWANPKTWGIGGKWGESDLYDLVTDVFVGERRVDRHVERFGYRDFRVVGTQFFLNGRRIRLQGDVATHNIAEPHRGEIVLDLLRRDGIDTIRLHDGDWPSASVLRLADRMGMLLISQHYPVLHDPRFGKVSVTNFQSFASFAKSSAHEWNKANCRGWWRFGRNHPSVVVWSADNEVMSQSKDTNERAPLSMRDDRVAADCEKYMKSLDPALVMTRDGDCGTWGRTARWHEEPPCDTANYHYPDFNPETKVYNWMETFDWRPVIYGETLYWAYGAWDKWVGATPQKVGDKARRVRRFAKLYRNWEVPAQIFMGLSSDGWTRLAADGSGNPMGLGGEKPDVRKWYRVTWPALSGSGCRMPAEAIQVGYSGNYAINWFDSSKASHIRNEVNEAYAETLEKRPKLRIGSDAEIVIAAEPNADVWALNESTGYETGVRADSQGNAWFRSLDAGQWRFRAGEKSVSLNLSARGEKAIRPGFDDVRKVVLK